MGFGLRLNSTSHQLSHILNCFTNQFELFQRVATPYISIVVSLNDQQTLYIVELVHLIASNN